MTLLSAEKQMQIDGLAASLAGFWKKLGPREAAIHMLYDQKSSDYEITIDLLFFVSPGLGPGGGGRSGATKEEFLKLRHVALTKAQATAAFAYFKAALVTRGFTVTAALDFRLRGNFPADLTA